MDYRSYTPSADLSAVVKCHWTLQVPAEMSGSRQRILPDGCVDMVFIFGDDIRRLAPDGTHVLQPRSMVLGQITEAFDVEPTGAVDSFAVRFYPHGFGCLVTLPLNELANRETPLERVFGTAEANALEQALLHAASTPERITIVEDFLRERLQRGPVIDRVIQETVDILLRTKGTTAVGDIVHGDRTDRRRLERLFNRKVGVGPKQLAKVIRLQAALRNMLDGSEASLTRIAYESDYFDQAHFSKDFKEFTGVSPKVFLNSELMALSAVLYKEA